METLTVLSTWNCSSECVRGTSYAFDKQQQVLLLLMAVAVASSLGLRLVFGRERL